MDTIRAARGAGKAQLRSAQERKKESKKKKQEEKEKGSSAPKAGGGGGDLMGDLFAKLSMRRKGISGSGKPGGGGEKSESSSSGGGGGSAMDKISAMIPSPPKPGTDGHGDDDDDWE